MELLASSIGSYVSTNKIAHTLASAGNREVTPKTVSLYLNYLRVILSSLQGQAV